MSESCLLGNFGSASLLSYVDEANQSESNQQTCEIIWRALQAPDVYTFYELLRTPSVESLRNSEEFSSLYCLLSLFAFGTYRQYTSQTFDRDLTLEQLNKLRHLTVVSLASETQTLSYRRLKEELGFTETTDLEDLIISAIYTGVIEAKLDGSTESVCVTETIARDVCPSHLDSVIDSLHTWLQSCSSVLSGVREEVTEANNRCMQHSSAKHELDSKINDLCRNIIQQDQSNTSLISSHVTDSSQSMSGLTRTKKLKTKSAKQSLGFNNKLA